MDWMVGMADSLRVVSRRQGVDGSRECAGRQGAIDSTMDRLVEQGAREPWLLFGAWFLAESRRGSFSVFRSACDPRCFSYFRIFGFGLAAALPFEMRARGREAERHSRERRTCVLTIPLCRRQLSDWVATVVLTQFSTQNSADAVKHFISVSEVRSLSLSLSLSHIS